MAIPLASEVESRQFFRLLEQLVEMVDDESFVGAKEQVANLLRMDRSYVHRILSGEGRLRIGQRVLKRATRLLRLDPAFFEEDQDTQFTEYRPPNVSGDWHAVRQDADRVWAEISEPFAEAEVDDPPVKALPVMTGQQVARLPEDTPETEFLRWAAFTDRLFNDLPANSRQGVAFLLPSHMPTLVRVLRGDGTK